MIVMARASGNPGALAAFLAKGAISEMEVLTCP